MLTLVLTLVSLAAAGVKFALDKHKMNTAAREQADTAFNQSSKPVANEGTPIPVLFGTTLITGSNIVWYHAGLNPSNTNLYTFGMHLVLAQAPVDRIYAIYNETTRLDGIPNAGVDTFGITNHIPPSHDLYKSSKATTPYEILPGHTNQVGARLFRDSDQGAFAQYDRGGFRGVASIVFGRVIPYHIAPTGKKVTYGFYGVRRGEKKFPSVSVVAHSTGVEYGATRSRDVIGNHKLANAGVIIRECYLNPVWGLGLSEADLDLPSFNRFITQLNVEQFGVSFLLTDSTKMSEFIDEVLRHVGGIRYVNRFTGKIHIELLREQDYTGLVTFNESAIRSIEAFKRPSLELLPTVQVVSFNRLRFDNIENLEMVGASVNGPWAVEKVEVQAQNTGAGQYRGQIAAQPQDYPGIADTKTALKIAQRDLRIASTPTAAIELTMNPESIEHLHPGDVFKIDFDFLSMSNHIFRVVTIDTGSLTDRSVRVTAVEDVYSLDGNTIEVTPDPQPEKAVKVENQCFFELPLWIRKQTYGDYFNVFTEDNAVLSMAAENPQNSMDSYKFLTSTSTDNSFGPFTDYRVVSGDGGDIPQSESYDYSSWIEWQGNEFKTEFLNTYWVVRSFTAGNTSREIVKIVDYNSSTGKIFIERGMLDTPAEPILNNYRMWRVTDTTGVLPFLSAPEQAITFRFLTAKAITRSFSGSVLPDAEADAEAMPVFNPVTSTGFRHQTEYPPKYLNFVQGKLTAQPTRIEWTHHDMNKPPEYQRKADNTYLGKVFQLKIQGEATGSGVFTNYVTVSYDNFYELTHATELSWNGLGRKSNWLSVEAVTMADVGYGTNQSLPQIRTLVR